MYFIQDIYLPKEDNAAAPIADVHQELWSDIQETIIGDGPDQFGRVYPRGTGKSAFGTLVLLYGLIVIAIKNIFLICSDIGRTAEKFIKDIKNILLENKYIRNGVWYIIR